MAIQDGVRKGDPILLEPIMKVEVVVPEEYLGDVLGDLNARRGQISGIHSRKDAQVVAASVPLSEMFGYATDLRSKTQGRAVYTMQFFQYQEVSEDESKKTAASDSTASEKGDQPTESQGPEKAADKAAPAKKKK